MNEPLDILSQAALEALRPLAQQLRERGWDAQLLLNAPSTGQRTATIELRMSMSVPIECAEAHS